jgi:Fe-S cluster assembly protein SufD
MSAPGIPFPSLATVALPEVPAAGSGDWPARIVESARAAAGRLPVPTPRDEDWRFTDVAQLAKQSYLVEAVPSDLPSAEVLRPLLLDEADGARLVFIDGRFAPTLSDTSALAAGVRLVALSDVLSWGLGGSIADGDASTAAEVRAHLARHAGFDADFFSALNTARLGDGAVLLAGRDVQIAGAVHLLFLSTARPAPLAIQPRVLVVAGAGSELTVVEEYAALGESIVFTNAVAECVVGPNASLHHVRLQRENRASFHVGRCAVSIARDGRYRSVSVNIGARLSRLDLNVTLDGQGAQAHLDGLALLDARQHSDSHTLLDHATPDGSSRQLHKCVCDGGSHAVFNGRILVRPDAQRTDSAQQSRGLLLSPKAQVNAKPQLEIFADDVKAAHGATVGQLDGDELFYLASRGLPAAQARKLLTYAFAAEVIERIPVRSLVARLAAQVMTRSGL